MLVSEIGLALTKNMKKEELKRLFQHRTSVAPSNSNATSERPMPKSCTIFKCISHYSARYHHHGRERFNASNLALFARAHVESGLCCWTSRDGLSTDIAQRVLAILSDLMRFNPGRDTLSYFTAALATARVSCDRCNWVRQLNANCGCKATSASH